MLPQGDSAAYYFMLRENMMRGDNKIIATFRIFIAAVILLN